MMLSHAGRLARRWLAARADESPTGFEERVAALSAALAAADLTLSVGDDGVAITGPDGRRLFAANSAAGTLELPGVLLTGREDALTYDTVDDRSWPHTPDLLLAQQAAFLGVRVVQLPTRGCTITAPSRFAWPASSPQLAHPATLVPARDTWQWPFDPFFTQGEAETSLRRHAWVTDSPPLLRRDPARRSSSDLDEGAELTNTPTDERRRTHLIAEIEQSAAAAGVALDRLPGSCDLWQVSRDGCSIGLAELDPSDRPRVELTSQLAHVVVDTRWLRNDRLKPLPWADVFADDCPNAGSIHASIAWAPNR